MVKTKKKATKKVTSTQISNKKSVDIMQYSSIIFGLGILVMLIASIIPVFTTVSGTITKVIAVTLILLGLVIGYLNITTSEAVSFMIATILIVMLAQPFLGSLVQAFGLQDNFNILKVLGGLYMYLNTLFVPAAIVVGLKTLFQTAKDE